MAARIVERKEGKKVTMGLSLASWGTLEKGLYEVGIEGGNEGLPIWGRKSEEREYGSHS